MIIGLGTDIQSVSELAHKEALATPGLFFTDAEYRRCETSAASFPTSLAGLIAAKEAFLKAFPNWAPCCWVDIEVCHRSSGAPYFVFHGNLGERIRQRGLKVLLSISHSADYATATVIVAEERNIS